MKVRDVMTKSPVFCNLSTNLGAAAEIMWKRKVGCLPVVDAAGTVVSVITDRDMCMALATRNRLAGEITVKEVASGTVYFCKPGDDIRTALNTMREKKVRRLPVVNAAGKLEGILTVDDVILHWRSKSRRQLPPDDIVRILQQLYSAQLRRARENAATA